MNSSAEEDGNGAPRTHQLLWTGGWDSTFRLLDLVFGIKRRVQSYYVLDPARRSTPMELETMEKIRGMVAALDGEAGERMPDLITIEKARIPENNEMTKAFGRLSRISLMGRQYDWLARWVSACNLHGLELCIHQDDKAHLVIANDVEVVTDGNDSFHRLRKNVSNRDLLVFSPFHFPLLNLTKLDMERMAKHRGFAHIMEETWFCHSPRNGKPCGVCNPCRYTRDEGLARRVPCPPLHVRIRAGVKRAVKNAGRFIGRIGRGTGVNNAVPPKSKAEKAVS